MYLTAKQAMNKELIKELASQMIGPVHSLQELRGRISFNYLVNGKYIFKLPSHRTRTSFWEKQHYNLPRLQEYLKYQIPIPQIDYLDLSGSKITACCYPKIEGKVSTKSAFRQLPLFKKIPFFENLSEAIVQLHRVNPDILPLPLSNYADALNVFLSNNQSQENYPYLKDVEETFQQQGIPLKRTSLCHLDLHAENIVSDDKNKIVGILDWDNLCIGEPFMEFRTALYSPSDLRILRKIYQSKTPKKIDPRKFQCMDDLYIQMKELFFLGELMNSPSKWEEKTTCSHNLGSVLAKNTDRWLNFSRD